jgi:hypothetical protein
MERKKVTISDAVACQNFTLAFGQFLDDFRLASGEEKHNLIAEEPTREGVDDVILSHVAAAVHKLANDNGLTVPQWVHDPIYIMSSPYYARDVQNVEFQKYLQETSPPEYVARNIFFGDNVLLRM